MSTSAETAFALTSQWHARLNLRYAPGGRRTRLVQRQHVGPLTVQKPFYPEGGVCHTYILHPPGGIAPGDRLSVDVTADAGASTLLTTPAAGKCYRSDGRLASLHQTVNVRGDAALEWLPQENILFQGCNADLSTLINLDPGARFIGWEMLCLGRPAAGEGFAEGCVRQRLELHRDSKPLLIERTRFDGGDVMLSAPWGLHDNTVLGTLIAVGVNREIFEDIKSYNNETVTALAASTLIDDVLVCRYLGTDIENARYNFISIWRQLRALLLDRHGGMPRIWNT